MQRVALLQNVPYLKAMAALEALNEKSIDGDSISRWIKETTGDDAKAEEAYTEWVTAVGSNKPVNIDAITLAQAAALLLGGKGAGNGD